MGANWSESKKRSSKKCGVSFKSDGSKDDEYLKKKRSFATVRLFLSACMISCASLRMNDSQGCTADVKDTPPSPKEKPDDLIGPDIGPVGDHDDLMAERRTLSVPAKSGFHIPLRQQSPFMMAHRSVEACGSGLTLMNDSFIRPRQDSLPRMVLKSMEAFGSGLSLMNDSFILTGQRSPPREEMNQELSSEVGWKHD